MKDLANNQKKLYKEFKVLKSRMETSDFLPLKLSKKLTSNVIDRIKNNQDVYVITTRYFGLNLLSLHAHSTLEFRLFNGTIMARKIKSYIKC